MSLPRSSRRARQSGAILISPGVAFMVLVAMGLVALLFMDDARPGRPKRVDRTDYPQENEIRMPDDGFRMVWRARQDGTGAPTLALFLRPSDAVEFSSGKGGRKILASDQTVLHVLAPSADSLKADPASGPVPCSALAQPFAGCSSFGVAQLTLHRGQSTTELYAALEELRLPRQDPHPDMRPKHKPQHDLRIFRTEADPQARRTDIRSWSCVQGAREPLVPMPGAACDPPAQADRGRSAVLFECGGGFCRAHFLYQQRLGELLFEFLPEPGAPEMRMRLFLAAWEMLNRQQADAHRPLDREFERADSAVQLESCRTTAREAARWMKDGDFADRRLFDLWHNRIARSCVRVEKTALRLATTEPDWSAQMLGQLLAIYREAGLRRDKKALYDAHLAIYERRGMGESEGMFDAMVDYLRHDGFVGLDGRDPIVPRALELAGKLELPMTDPRVLLVRERMARGLDFKKQHAELVRFNEQTIAGIVKEKGPLDARLVPLLRAQAYGDLDAVGVKRTADHLARLWHAQPKPDPATGFDVVLLYNMYAFQTRQFEAVMPAMTRTVERLEETAGRNNRYVKAARFHYSEVVERREKGRGKPIGGGFLD